MRLRLRIASGALGVAGALAMIAAPAGVAAAGPTPTAATAVTTATCADGHWPAQAVFSEPGTYVLQCVADDGGLLGTDSLTVHVTK